MDNLEDCNKRNNSLSNSRNLSRHVFKVGSVRDGPRTLTIYNVNLPSLLTAALWSRGMILA